MSLDGGAFVGGLLQEGLLQASYVDRVYLPVSISAQQPEGDA